MTEELEMTEQEEKEMADAFAEYFAPLCYDDPWVENLKIGDKVKISTKGDVIFNVIMHELSGTGQPFGILYRLRLENSKTKEFHDDIVKPDGVSVYYVRHLIKE
jgi:hypothetical protein